MKIIGFYHVLLKNHWREIVQEQIDCIVNSQLYVNCEHISIGCIGEEKEKDQLVMMLANYPKFRGCYFGEDITKYEFPTLDMLKHYADSQDEDCAIFYIHTKGASFEKSNQRGYEGGNYWRGYMNFYNITNWENALHEIEMGYDVVGVKLRTVKEPPAHRLHFSGNYFWTHSSYVKKLPAIASLNKQNRFEAEFWHGSANPKVISMCQTWVDYNSKGKWIDPPLIKKRNIVHTLCWNLFSEVEKTVEDLYHRNDKKDFIHVLVDLGFPLEKGDEIPDNIEEAKLRNSEKLKTLAQKYGSIYFQTENIGVSQNWTQVARFMKVTEHDILICADPDERVKTDGWVKAIANVMRYNKKYAWLSLKMPEYDSVLNPSNITEYRYWDIRVWEIKGNLNWAQGAMAGSLICKMGNAIPFPSRYPIYGGIESAVREEMRKHCMTWGVMPDFIVEHTNEVPLLREWKDQIIFRIADHGQMKFEKFLQMKKQAVL